MANILICDDDPTIHKLVGEFLKRSGHEVTFAKDGLDALVLLKKQKPDLMVLDVMMPEINGYDVCHNVKFDDRLKDLPIVLLTSRDQELDERQGALMGIAYMSKNCSPKELTDKVNQILAARQLKK
ncbi:MAG: response regulator [Candidatus Omnitrophica bacterium]|nr:response regulator [Candidatus Omnitrophota bacterium]